jgi:hypothetical protein
MSALDELARAIVRSPDDDTIRLAYADELRNTDPVRVPCPECGDREDPGVSCPRCAAGPGVSGDGTVPSTENADRAEFIELQLYLHAIEFTAEAEGGYPDFAAFRGALGRAGDLSARYPHWRPTCPECKGHGFVAYHSEGECLWCGSRGRVGSGRVGTLRRGFLWDVGVPSMSCVLVPDAGRPGAHVPTEWARDLIENYPTIQSVFCADLAPYVDRAVTLGDGFRNTYDWLVCSESDYLPGVGSIVPRAVGAVMQRRRPGNVTPMGPGNFAVEHESADQANRHLAEALVEALRDMCRKEPPK